MKIGIVILNYLAYEETINCIESLELQDKKSNEVRYVIVDNCSDNDSFCILKKKYENRNDIDVVKTKKNIGFAKGNNFGYSILKKNYDPDFVIFSNDDILLPQYGLYNWIGEMYKNYKFGVLGPKVYSVKGKFYQSPMENCTTSIFECNRLILRYYLKLIKNYLKNFMQIKGIEKQYATWDNKYYKYFTDKKTIHGSFMIFSNKYLKIFEFPFDNRTYLYMEEDIIRLRCNLKKIKMIYSPEYCVDHLQAVSTNKINITDYDKQKFRICNHIKSLKIYKKILKEEI